jgi:hypothetical protein
MLAPLYSLNQSGNKKKEEMCSKVKKAINLFLLEQIKTSLYAVPERDSIVGYCDAELPVACLVNERLFDARANLVDYLLCSGGQRLLKEFKL